MDYIKKFINLFKRKEKFSGFEVRFFMNGKLQSLSVGSPIEALQENLPQVHKVSEISFLSGYKLIPFLERTDHGHRQDN